MTIHQTLETLKNRNPMEHGAVSFFYTLLLDRVDTSTDLIKQAWERELEIELTNDSWDDCLKSIHDCSINARHAVIQFKVLHRLHYSRAKLHKIFPNIPPTCVKCNTAEGTLAHTFWTCEKIWPFWKNIFDFLSEAYTNIIKPDPEIAIFGNMSGMANKYQSQAVSLCMILAKRAILQKWKKESGPTFETWIRELSNVLPLEELRYKLVNRPMIFQKIWSPIKSLIGYPEI